MLFASLSSAVEHKRLLEGKDCALITCVSLSLAQRLAFGRHLFNVCLKMNYTTQRDVFPAFPHEKQGKKWKEISFMVHLLLCLVHFIYYLSDRWKLSEKYNCEMEMNEELHFYTLLPPSTEETWAGN